jgi:hypothetical protein
MVSRTYLVIGPATSRVLVYFGNRVGVSPQVASDGRGLQSGAGIVVEEPQSPPHRVEQPFLRMRSGLVQPRPILHKDDSPGTRLSPPQGVKQWA